MPALNPPKNLSSVFFITTCIVMLSMAFYQCYKTTHDLQWAADPDFDRDIGFIRGTLNGHYGNDPNYKGEFLWYNPLLFSIETSIAKITSIPPNIVVTRAGACLNIFAPIAFLIMCASLFGFEIAITSLLSFLFLSSGNILGWGAATYSPWLYPVCFTQFLFYINILLCYKAFSTEKIFWFAVLGIFTGISFLGHAAPTLLIILILASLQSQKILASFKMKNYAWVTKYLVQGVTTFVFFVIAAMPLLYFVIGKYRLHLINRATFEYTEGIFILSNFKEMIKENLSFSLLVAIAGFIWFYKNFHHQLIRRIIFAWLFFSVTMYLFATFVATMDNRFHIRLPGTVPSFHYFFYLKALQSVFFGFGLVFLIRQVLKWVTTKRPKLKIKQESYFFIVIALICSLIYFPFYSNRSDFTILRDEAIAKQNQKDKIEVYDFILKNIPEDKVVLCDKDPSIFPVMATARKMVSIAYTFSNPYVDFDKRENDRNNMILFLKTGKPEQVRSLFHNYETSYVLLENAAPVADSSLLKNIVFRNKSFSIYTLKDD